MINQLLSSQLTGLPQRGLLGCQGALLLSCSFQFGPELLDLLWKVVLCCLLLLQKYLEAGGDILIGFRNILHFRQQLLVRPGLRKVTVSNFATIIGLLADQSKAVTHLIKLLFGCSSDQ